LMVFRLQSLINNSSKMKYRIGMIIVMAFFHLSHASIPNGRVQQVQNSQLFLNRSLKKLSSFTNGRNINFFGKRTQTTDFPKKKVMIMMSDTGGGHRASAVALVDAFEKLQPGKISCDIVDIWTDYGSWPYNRAVPFYKMCARNPALWRVLWWGVVFRPGSFVIETLVHLANVGKISRCIEKYNPDLILSVHPLCQKEPLCCTKRLSLAKDMPRIPFVTVVTDLGSAHPTWFHKDVDLCFVPSNNVRTLAEKRGVLPHQIRQYSLPLRQGFWNGVDQRTKPEVRTSLGLSPNRRTALVLGGGDGMGAIEDIANEIGRTLTSSSSTTTSMVISDRSSNSGIDSLKGGGSGSDDEHGDDFQMVVVCGSNQQAYKTLSEMAEKRVWGDNLKVTVVGYVPNMEDYMAASDCVVTKAGPGTICEAMTKGLPTLLSFHLPGQEAGNFEYVAKHGFGTYCTNPKKIGQIVADWMNNPHKLAEMSKKALKMSCPSATLDIARDILTLLNTASNEDKACALKNEKSS